MRRLGKERPNKHYDVLVVGAGMVGAAAATGLAAQGFDVLLIDAVDFSDRKAQSPSFDDRSTALSYGSRQILNDLGIWKEVEGFATPIRRIHVSEKSRWGVTRMNASDYDVEALGYVVPNLQLGNAMFTALNHSSLDYLSPAIIKDISHGSESHRLVLSGDTDQTVDATLLLLADGANSKTAKRLGISYHEHCYHQHALICNVESYEPHGMAAFERFTPDGPVALLPLSELAQGRYAGTQNRFSLVWTLSDEQVESTMGLSDKDFMSALSDVFGGRFGGFLRCGERQCYPLNLTRAQEQFRPGVLLLGNAAHSLHPVAGQGFNLALRGVACFLAHIVQAKLAARSIRSLELLTMTVAEHEKDQRVTIGLSDQLVKQFVRQTPGLGLLRELGLVGLNNIPFAKKLFVEQAMGMGGRSFEVSPNRG